MVERVAQRIRNRSRPRQKFFVRSRIPRNIFLRHAVGPHRPPFIVIALQPDLEEVAKPAIFRNVSWREMTVIIENRLRRGELMIEPPRYIDRKSTRLNSSHMSI